MFFEPVSMIDYMKAYKNILFTDLKIFFKILKWEVKQEAMQLFDEFEILKLKETFDIFKDYFKRIAEYHWFHLNFHQIIKLNDLYVGHQTGMVYTALVLQESILYEVNKKIT